MCHCKLCDRKLSAEKRKRWIAEDPDYLRRDSERVSAYNAKHLSETRTKKLAQRAVRTAVESGRLVKSYFCECCGSGGRLDGHHENYNKPLEVIWLCRMCHQLIHTKKENIMYTEKQIHDFISGLTYDRNKVIPGATLIATVPNVKYPGTTVPGARQHLTLARVREVHPTEFWTTDGQRVALKTGNGVWSNAFAYTFFTATPDQVEFVRQHILDTVKWDNIIRWTEELRHEDYDTLCALLSQHGKILAEKRGSQAPA